MELTIAIIVTIFRLLYEKGAELLAEDEAKKITKYKR